VPRYVPPHRRQAFPKFFSICHHCGKVGYNRPNCFKLKPHEHKNDSPYPKNSYKGLCNMMMVVLNRLGELDKSHKTAPSAKKAWL